MWCIDLDKKQLSRKDGVIVHIQWLPDGELVQTLDNAVNYSVLRQEMLLAETRLLIDRQVVKRMTVANA